MTTTMAPETPAPAAGLTAYVAAEIRAHLGRHSISKSALARRLGVDDTWIGKRLNQRTEMTLTDLERIATALEVPAARFLPREERISRSSFVPLGERVLATIGEGRPPRRVQRRHRPGRAVPRTRPVTPLPA